jgi:hypothetical protein
MSETNCVVVMGSHNQGYKASYANDEDLFRANRALALTYTHIMDVYDDHRWRCQIQGKQQHAWTGLVTTPDWQQHDFQPASMAYQELEFWVGSQAQMATAAPSAPKLVVAAAAGAGASSGTHGTSAAATKGRQAHTWERSGTSHLSRHTKC